MTLSSTRTSASSVESAKTARQSIPMDSRIDNPLIPLRLFRAAVAAAGLPCLRSVRDGDVPSENCQDFQSADLAALVASIIGMSGAGNRPPRQGRRVICAGRGYS